MQKLLRAATTSLCLLAATGAGATIHNVGVYSNYFTPASATVSLGDTVRWNWVNGAHTTTSGSIPAGAATWNAIMNANTPMYQYIPNVVGTHNYICQPHQASGMIGSFTVVCSAPQAGVITAAPGTVVCPGGSVMLTTPAVAGATYEWKQGTTVLSSTTNSQTATAAGSYTVKITTACGNATSAPIQLSQGTAPTVNVTHSAVNVCQGKCDSMGATGGLTYQWPTMAGLTANGSTASFCPTSATTPGPVIINLVATNQQGCATTQPVTVNVLKTPVPNFTHTHSGQAYTFANTTTDTNASGNTWSWNFGDGSPVSAQKHPSHTYTTPGSYTVTLNVTSGNTCQKAVTKQLVTTAAGNLAVLGDVTLSPNPAAETVRLTGLDNGTITICDYTGKSVQSLTITGRSMTFSVARLPAGMYFIRVQSNGNVATERLSVAH